MGQVVRLLERPVYAMAQVDPILGLRTGTSRRWIDGYVRGGRTYQPVVRDERTDDDTVTWGEFVETRLLAEFRGAGVPMVRMRPAVQRLKQELGTPYPLASARAWLETSGRELVRSVQDDVQLDAPLSLVVRNHQQLLWSPHAESFRSSLEWTSHVSSEPRLLRPMPGVPQVEVDPLRGYGEPVVRGVPTAVVAELFRAGEPLVAIADQYDLGVDLVDAALRYELKRSSAA